MNPKGTELEDCEEPRACRNSGGGGGDGRRNKPNLHSGRRGKKLREDMLMHLGGIEVAVTADPENSPGIIKLQYPRLWASTELPISFEG